MEIDTKNLIKKIPKEVLHVTEVLLSSSFEAYLVGGCVRDLLIGKDPKDWDITTNAKPEEVIKLFEKTVYENKFGTVGVCVPIINKELDVKHETKESIKNIDKIEVSHATPINIDISIDNIELDVKHETDNNKYSIIEVTTYRLESSYSDFRHPDEVKYSNNIEDDLQRRDFTMNSIAFCPLEKDFIIKDIFGGIKDIQDKIIRTVGNPDERFNEDALRMLRAVRFSLQLDFTIEKETADSIFKNSHLIKNISQERIRDEFIKIIMSKNPAIGITLLQKFNLLKYIIPELEEGINCEQSGEHIYDVYNHLLHALQHAADKNWPLEVRLSALFHDIGKPKSRRNINQKIKSSSAQVLPRPSGNGQGGSASPRPDHSHKNFKFSAKKKKYTFYGHEVIGERMTKKILERLKFSKKEIDLINTLVRNHMFFSDTEKITLSAVRRIIAKVGRENIWTLMNVRECDRVGMKKKEAPYRLRKYFAMIEEALHDPISVKQLKINGEDLIKMLNMKPGPRIGYILNALLEEVLDDATKNDKGHLLELAKSLNMLGDNELRTLGERGKDIKDKLEEEEIEKLHNKHNVKK